MTHRFTTDEDFRRFFAPHNWYQLYKQANNIQSTIIEANRIININKTKASGGIGGFGPVSKETEEEAEVVMGECRSQTYHHRTYME